MIRKMVFESDSVSFGYESLFIDATLSFTKLLWLLFRLRYLC